MLEVVVICSVFVAISLVCGRSLLGDGAVNPVAIFFGIWLGDFALFSANRYLHIFFVGLADGGQLLFQSSFLAFGLAALATAAALGPPGRRPSRLNRVAPRLQWVSRRIAAVYAVGALSKYAVLVHAFGLSPRVLFMSRAAVAGGEFTYPWICELLTTFGYLLSLNLGVLAGTRAGWRHWAWFAALEVAAAINDAPTGYRGQSMNFAIFFGCALLLARSLSGSRLRLRHLAAVALGSVALALSLEAVHLAADWSGSGLVPPAEAGMDPAGSAALRLALNYVDVVGTIPAVEWYLAYPRDTNLEPSSHPALNTFRGLYQLADKLGRPLGYPVLPDQEMPSARTNSLSGDTFTAICYLTMFDADFGFWGMVLASAALGSLSVAVVRLAFVAPSVATVEVGASVLALLAGSWREFYLADPFFYVTLALIFAQRAWLKAPPLAQPAAVAARGRP